MNTNYNRKDLVEFTNYVLELNSKRKENNPVKNLVTHANVENWLEIKKARKLKSKIPVLAKFHIDSIDNHQDEKEVQVFLSVVSNGTSEENKHFSTLTPTGQINISINKDSDAYNFFEIGEEVYVKFSKFI